MNNASQNAMRYRLIRALDVGGYVDDRGSPRPYLHQGLLLFLLLAPFWGRLVVPGRVGALWVTSAAVTRTLQPTDRHRAEQTTSVRAVIFNI